jgi:hypothetical protein
MCNLSIKLTGMWKMSRKVMKVKSVERWQNES